MNGLKAMLEVTEHGRPVEVTWNPELPKQALIDAVHAAIEKNGLAASQPWALASRTARELEDMYGYAPFGGWGKLIGLAAGQRWFSARQDKFEARVDIEDIERLSEQRVQVLLIEAFTRQLCPPQSIAGMLVALDLHPMWGLRAAHEARSKRRGGPALRDESLFPPDVLEHVQMMIFGTIAGFTSVLRQLKASHAYPMDPMAGLFFECAIGARSVVMEVAAAPRTSLPVFLGADITRGRALTDFLHADMFEGVLVPANAAQRLADGRVIVCPKVLSQARVGDFDDEDVAHWGSWLSAGVSMAC